MTVPVPAGTDAPCDFAEDWCETTEAINARLAPYETALARCYPAVPCALMRLTETQTVATFAAINFTEATFDTAGMTDLDADPQIITVRRAGRYTLRGFYRLATTTGVNNNPLLARVTSRLPTSPLIEYDGYILDRNVLLFPYANGTFETVCTVPAGAQIQLINGSVSTISVARASLSVLWHSDMERPS